MTTSKETPAVEVGQVWADNDKRAAGRQVKVLRLYSQRERTAWARRRQDYSADAYVEVQYAECEVVAERPTPVRIDRMNTISRRVHIRVDRMRPTSTGYRLVSSSTCREDSNG